MTKKGVRLLFIMLSSLMLAVVMVACAKQEPTGEETADIPQEVQNAAENYLEAFKKGGAAESTKYAYYPNKTLGMNGSALYEVNTTAKMGTYKATFTVTEKQKWTPSVRLYDDAAPSSTRTAGMETFSAGQIVMTPDGNKQYTLPTDSVINAVYGETFTNTAYMMSVEELYDQFWDENLKTHVMRLKDYGVGDSIQVCDTISAVKYEPDKDRTILEFLTKYGTAYWPFDGDLTEEYRAGDEVSFQFQVVKEYDTGSYIFESLDYFQAALNKLDNPEMSLYIADYIAR